MLHLVSFSTTFQNMKKNHLFIEWNPSSPCKSLDKSQ
jgi:hypothetical protein